jgi:hypothetical protein
VLRRAIGKTDEWRDMTLFVIFLSGVLCKERLKVIKEIEERKDRKRERQEEEVKTEINT